MATKDGRTGIPLDPQVREKLKIFCVLNGLTYNEALLVLIELGEKHTKELQSLTKNLKK